MLLHLHTWPYVYIRCTYVYEAPPSLCEMQREQRSPLLGPECIGCTNTPIPACNATWQSSPPGPLSPQLFHLISLNVLRTLGSRGAPMHTQLIPFLGLLHILSLALGALSSVHDLLGSVFPTKSRLSSISQWGAMWVSPSLLLWPPYWLHTRSTLLQPQATLVGAVSWC